MDFQSEKQPSMTISAASVVMGKIEIPAVLLKIRNTLISVEAINDAGTELACSVGLCTLIEMSEHYYDPCKNTILHTDALAVMKNINGIRTSTMTLIAKNNLSLIVEVESLLLHQDSDCAFILQTLKPEPPYKSEFSPSNSVAVCITENASESFIILDRNFCIVDYSRQFEHLIRQYLKKDLQKGQSILHVLSGEMLSEVLARCESVLEGEAKFSEMDIAASEEKTEKIIVSYKPVRGEQEIVDGIFISAKRVSEKTSVLLQSEKRFKALVHDGSDMIAILDDMANYLYVSPSSKSVLDFEPDSFIGKNAFEFIHPDDIEKAQQEFESAVGKKKFSLSPFRFIHNNGSWRWVQTVVTDLREATAVSGFVANSRDITDLIVAQNALVISNERYRYAGKATSDAVWDWDLDTGSIYYGEGFLKFGYSQSMRDSDKETLKQRIHPLDIQRVQERMDAFISSRNTNWTDDYRFLKADGSYAHVVDKGFVIRDTTGKALRMIGAVQDITFRKLEEAWLRILESVVTNTIDAVLVSEIRPAGDFMTKIIFVNQAFEKMTGYQAHEVEGRNPWFLQGSGSDKSELIKLMSSIRDNLPYQGTIINYRKNGTQIWVSYSVTPIMDQQGNYSHWIAILRDVSEEKNLEFQKVLLAELTDIFNGEKGLKYTVTSALIRISEFGRFGCAAVWTIDPLLGKLDLTGEYFIDQPTKNITQEVLSGQSGEAYVLQILEKGNAIDWVIGAGVEQKPDEGFKVLSGIPLHHNSTLIGVLLLGSLKDDESRLNILPEQLGGHLGTELHRKKIEQDLKHIFNLAPDIIAITDFSGNFKKLNPAASKLLGYSHHYLTSLPFSEFLHPEDKENTLKNLLELQKSGDIYAIEERYLTSDGRSKWLAWTSQPLKNEQLIYSVGKDITEKRELEELLLNSNSIARIGSWEIKYPQKIVSWSEIMREIMDVKPDFAPDCDRPLGEFYPQSAMNIMNERITRSITNGDAWDEVLQVRTLTNKLKWIRIIGSAEIIAGKCLRLFGSIQDVDLQKRTQISAAEARQELEESERRYSELFHLSPLPMWVYDFYTLNFLDVNQTAIAQYGYSRKEFLNMNIRNIRPAQEVHLLEKTLQKTRKKEATVFQGAFKHRRKNGEIIHVDVKSNTIMFKGTKAKLVVATDITERLEYITAVEKRNERLREIAWIQSHKVRAPLARLMGLVNMLSLNPSVDENAKKILTYIDTSADELDLVIREVTLKSEELDI